MTNTIAEVVAAGVLPGRVWIYSNYHCNLACSYCLTESGPGVPARALTTQRMVAVAQQASALGFTDLGVTGGEPFLAVNMADTLATLGEHLPVVALTNGTLFGGRRLGQLARLGGRPIALQISLDSADPDVNDAARGPENFAKVVAAIPRIVELGVEVRIATTAADISDRDLERLCALHRALGVSDDHHIVRPIVRRGRAATRGVGVGVAPADLPPELTITADGAFWSPFGPTVLEGRVDTDLLLTRTTEPLEVAAVALLRAVEGRPPGEDTALNIR